MLRSIVDRGMERRHLARDAGDVDDGFPARRTSTTTTAGGGGEEVGNGELGRADRMGEIDIQDGVAVRRAAVLGRRVAGRVPEVRKGLLGAGKEGT